MEIYYATKYWNQCTSLLVILMIINLGEIIGLVDTSGRCESITIPLCKEGIGYNYTVMPNFRGHEKQDVAAVDILQFLPLVKINCNDRFRLFLCSFYAPVCTVLEKPIPPCRSLCTKVKEGCEQVMNTFGFQWPEYFQCKKFPKGGLCVGEKNTSTVRYSSNPKRNNGNAAANDTIQTSTDKVRIPVFLLFTTMYDIRLLDIPSKDLITLYSSQESIAPVDFHYANYWIFWASNSEGKIFRGTIKLDVIREIMPIIETAPAMVESLSVDWYADMLYWVETYPNRIRVATLDGHYPTTVVTAGVHSTKSLIVDPKERLLFWIDWNGILYSPSSAIKSCDMSGNNQQIVFNITEAVVADSGRPLGLSADREARRLYWADAKSESLHTIDYSGNGYRLILTSHSFLSEVNSLSVYGDYMFWTDRTTSSVNMLTLSDPVVKDVERLQTLTAVSPLDIKVFHPGIQSPGTPDYNVTLDLTALVIEYPIDGGNDDDNDDDDEAEDDCDNATTTSKPTTFITITLSLFVLACR